MANDANKKKIDVKAVLIDFFILTFGTLIISASVFFFLMPSHASVSSISGLAIVLQNFVPYSVATITMFFNVVLLIIGFITCGKEFGIKTVYTSLLLPTYVGIFERVFPNYESMTGNDAIDVLAYVFFVSIGLAMLFIRNASSGGLDIVAKIMNKYLKMDMGKALGLSGLVIALSSALVYPKRTVVLSIIGTYVNGIVVDHFIFQRNIKRRICIVSIAHQDEILNYILHELHSGATLYEAEGAYTGEKYKEIITIVDKREYQLLMDYINKCDPEAFLTVYNVSDMHYQPKLIKTK